MVDIVEQFRTTLILANAHMAVVLGERSYPIVPNLVDMVGTTQEARLKLRNGTAVGSLIARVLKSRQTKLIFDPRAEIAGTVRVLVVT